QGRRRMNLRFNEDFQKVTAVWSACRNCPAKNGQHWQDWPIPGQFRNSHMQITTASLIVNPCDDEYDDMALLCCHSEDGELFSLTRFPDENEVEITIRDDKTHTVSSLKVTFSAERLLVEIDPADGNELDGHQLF